MTIKLIIKLTSALILFSTLCAANAANISLSPVTTTTISGSLVLLDVIIDFSDVTTIGGGFDVVYDSLNLSFVAWNPNIVGDPGFARNPDVSDGLLSGIGIGDFNTGISGVHNLGTLSFILTSSPGTTTMVSLTDTLSTAGPFVDFNTFQVIPVQYNGTTVNAVPVPAAVWLMFSGLGALFGLARKRNDVSQRGQVYSLLTFLTCRSKTLSAMHYSNFAAGTGSLGQTDREENAL